MSSTCPLPPGVRVFERGWLSANNVLLQDAHNATLVDSGYVTHQAQTLALVQHALQGRTLDQLANTHLHSDHCGGNQALQAHLPGPENLDSTGPVASCAALARGRAEL
jgi:glyoxylase-like metal-dependent hydrolase (beta-lactamase superfamily II)